MRYRIAERVAVDVRLEQGAVRLDLPAGEHDVTDAEAAAIDAVLVPRGLAERIPDTPAPVTPRTPRTRPRTEE